MLPVVVYGFTHPSQAPATFHDSQPKIPVRSPAGVKTLVPTSQLANDDSSQEAPRAGYLILKVPPVVNEIGRWPPVEPVRVRFSKSHQCSMNEPDLRIFLNCRHESLEIIGVEIIVTIDRKYEFHIA